MSQAWWQVCLAPGRGHGGSQVGHDEGPEVDHEEILRSWSTGQQPPDQPEVQEQHRKLWRLLGLNTKPKLQHQLPTGNQLEQFHQQQLQAGKQLGHESQTGGAREEG